MLSYMQLSMYYENGFLGEYVLSPMFDFKTSTKFSKVTSEFNGFQTHSYSFVSLNPQVIASVSLSCML